MSALPKISDAEFEVMNVIWSAAPIDTNEIVARVTRARDWSPKTVQTMLSRLEKKGVVRHEKEGRVFVYVPRIEKQAYLEAESSAFAARFFDGAFRRLVVQYLDREPLTPEKIDDLQAILDQKRNR